MALGPRRRERSLCAIPGKRSFAMNQKLGQDPRRTLGAVQVGAFPGNLDLLKFERAQLGLGTGSSNLALVSLHERIVPAVRGTQLGVMERNPPGGFASLGHQVVLGGSEPLQGRKRRKRRKRRFGRSGRGTFLPQQ